MKERTIYGLRAQATMLAKQLQPDIERLAENKPVSKKFRTLLLKWHEITEAANVLFKQPK